MVRPAARDPRYAAEPSQVTQASEALSPVVILYLFCVVVPLGINIGPLVVTSLRMILIILIIPMLVQLLSGKLGRINAADILFALFTLWMSLALIVVDPGQAITQIGSVGAEFIGGYLVGRTYIRSRGAYLALCRWLIIIACLMLPFALLETVTGDPILVRLLRAVPGMNTVPIVSYEKRMGLERVQLMFAHPIHFGLFCSVIFSQAFVAMTGMIPTGKRYFVSFLSALEAFLSLSSGALLSIILQLGLIAWNHILRKTQQRWWGLVGLFVLAYIMIDLLSNRTPTKVFMSYATFSAHTAYWRGLIFEYGMQNVWAHPLFGIGMGDWARPASMHTSSVDNFWLLITMRYGIMAFILMVIGYFVPLFRIMFRDFSLDPLLAQIRLAWVFTFLGLSFTLVTVHIWSNIFSFVFFMFGSGMWLLQASPQQDKDTEPTPNAQRPAPGKYGRPQPGRPTTDPAAGLRYSRFAARTRPPRENKDADL